MDNFWWKIIGIVVSIVAIIVPSYVAYDIYQKESISSHELEIEELFRSNPTSFLSDLDGKFKLTADGKIIDNLSIIYFGLRNSGNKPILPKQYFENLTVSVGKKWKIVGVSNESSSPKGLTITWKQTESGGYSAEPLLINPEDGFTIAVYVVGDPQIKKTDEKIAIDWTARIENLSRISTREAETIKFKLSGIVVLLSGWALPFTVVSFIFMLGLVLILSRKAGVISNISAMNIVLIVFYATLAISACEVLAYYIYEPINVGGAAWINWSILVIQSMVLVWLSVLLVKRKSA